MSNQKLPDLLEILTPLFEQCDPQEQRILLAILERLAAKRYRAWAETLTDPQQKQGFLACAEREEQIAEAVEALHPQAKEIADIVWKRLPNIDELYAEAMRSLSPSQQWQVQAVGELGGAELLRGFAKAETNPEAREALLACAPKEEASSHYLQDILKNQ